MEVAAVGRSAAEKKSNGAHCCGDHMRRPSCWWWRVESAQRSGQRAAGMWSRRGRGRIVAVEMSVAILAGGRSSKGCMQREGAALPLAVNAALLHQAAVKSATAWAARLMRLRQHGSG